MKSSSAIALIACLLLIGCTMPVLPTGEKIPHYCEKNLDCLKQQTLNACSSANAVFEQQGITAELKVRPGNGRCILHVALKDIQLPSTASAEDRNQVEQLRPLFPLATMDCKLNYGQAAALSDHRFLTSTEFLENCDGKLKDEVIARLGIEGNFTVDVPLDPSDDRDIDDPKYWPTPYPKEYFYTPTPSPTPTPTPRPTYVPKVFGNFVDVGGWYGPVITPTPQPTVKPRITPNPTPTPWVKPTPAQ